MLVLGKDLGSRAEKIYLKIFFSARLSVVVSLPIHFFLFNCFHNISFTIPNIGRDNFYCKWHRRHSVYSNMRF